ncbi:Csu type fimbrial protein [Phyllobacterium endophyticum]|uniref:Spore coat protein U n=1 Tax=Phyllobacterium endophyticum TaxID=1149773 RepID=A0A2P7AUG1_9HYPH|nr:spore coat U domain-containing protein [Phyllobacterium endophyticum]MBB3234315.1 spore coat protein U-like protein [Phyllobacterium endophyticum]PSH57846.1 spore coat protein U [Phyllobacterium endophyticum]TYR44053.1 spore coat protein U domain-containing protein [Phyllobacterium endophyticum]
MTLRFSTRIACAAIVAASFGLTGPAFAAAKTGTLNVKLEIVSGCSVFTSSAVGTLNFGTWTTLSDTIEQSTTLNVSCSAADQTFNVLLDGGQNGTIADRNLALASDKTKKIKYNLYTDGGYGTVWGETVGTDTVEKKSTTPGTNVPFTIFGRVPLQTPIPAAGIYTDTVTVTVKLN